MTMAVAVPDSGAALAEKVVITGDLSKLTAEERMGYYSAVCRSLGLNPLTRPFEYITLNGKLTLYATRGAADQLRAVKGITITRLERELIGDVYVVTAYGRDASGREDGSTGAVPVKGLAGEAMANAYMKAETKAKRRLTLSLAGLGMSDESEIGSIPTASLADVDPETGEIRKPLSLSERAAERAAAVRVEEIPAAEAAAVEVTDPQDEAAPGAETPGAETTVASAASSDPEGYRAFAVRLNATSGPARPSRAQILKTALAQHPDIPNLGLIEPVSGWPFLPGAWAALGDALGLPMVSE
jgi:hypothetical protein